MGLFPLSASLPHATFLIVDDKPLSLQLTRINLETGGYLIVPCEHPEKAIPLIEGHRPDLVILDLEVEDAAGLCVRIRERSTVPIVVLTGQSDDAVETRAFALGADDYIVKPYASSVLIARLGALLRRVRELQPAPALKYGELEIDLTQMRVTVSGKTLALTPIEYRVLTCLVQHIGRPVPEDAIMAQIWGNTGVGDPAVLRVYIGRLRHRLESLCFEPHMILALEGRAYQLLTPQPVMARL
jgi:two-component system KDP operon response regulator KdpE